MTTARSLIKFKKSGKAANYFNLRKFYLSEVVPSDKYDNFYEPSVSRFYGKADLDGNIVYPSEKYLSTLVNPNKKSGKTYYALNFVAKAFSDFRQFYIKGISQGAVQQDSFLNIIEPTKGWQSMHDLYATNINNMYFRFVNDYLENLNSILDRKNNQPTNFNEFMNSFGRLYSTQKSPLRMSRSSFILSNKCPLSITGLSIEIGPAIDFSNDTLKKFLDISVIY